VAAGGIKEYSTGMLVVESVVPGGPADGVLEPGDVLVGALHFPSLRQKLSQ
jgi:hypothetical protein